MGFFEYRGEDAGELVGTAFRLAFFDREDELGFESLEAEGWTVLSPEDLGLPNWVLDELGMYQGFTTLDAQALAYVHTDSNGNPDQVAIAFSGGNVISDVLDTLQFWTGTYDDSFDYLFAAIKGYAIDNGLTGSDVLFTGYSNGGAATNLVSAEANTLQGGFFANSDFIAFEALIINPDDDLILNIGFENSSLFGIYDEVGSLSLPSPRGPEAEFESASDNFILFNDHYADPTFPGEDGWTASSLPAVSAHSDAVLRGDEESLVERIATSEYYEYTEEDSVLLLSYLDDTQSGQIWVEDGDRLTSDHYGDSYFAIGTYLNDKLGDGAGSDYLDGGDGDDLFRLGAGNDHVYGGSGTDEVQLSGALGNYDIIRLSDGTTYFNDETGVNGLEELTEVESVDFGGTSYDVTASGLTQGGTVVATYTAATEGTAASETMNGTASDDIIFAKDGDDAVNGWGGHDLLHGGDGDDVIWGWAGDDQIFGEAGNDTIDSGTGNDVLSGGLGSDTFVFAPLSGDDVITDFNMGAGDVDVLDFSFAFLSPLHALLAANQVGDDVVFNYGLGDSVTLLDYDVADLTLANFAT